MKQPLMPFPSNYSQLSPMARHAVDTLLHAQQMRINPPQPAIVTVDIPPRPIPGRKTSPGIDPTTIPHPHR